MPVIPQEIIHSVQYENKEILESEGNQTDPRIQSSDAKDDAKQDSVMGHRNNSAVMQNSTPESEHV